MAEGLTNDLIWASLYTWVISFIFVARDFQPVLSIAVVSIRVAIPLVYFAWGFDGQWTLIDDLVYTEGGNTLIQAGFTPWSVFYESGGTEFLYNIAGGQHMGYHWWNLCAQYFFGEHYYSACFLNVAITFLAAHLFGHALQFIGVKSSSYRLACEVFLILHWDVVAWTSFVNLKDVLIQSLTIAMFYWAAGFVRTRRLRYVVGFILTTVLLVWIRFYIPPLMLTAIGIWMFTQWQDRRRYILLPLVALSCYIITLNLTEHLHNIDSQNMLFGAVKFALTPPPWGPFDSGYSFLIVPSILHWLFFVPALYGSFRIWQQYPIARVALIYLAIIVVFYGATDAANGSRHRVQVSFIVAWAQFHALWCFREAIQLQRQFGFAVRVQTRPVGQIARLT